MPQVSLPRGVARRRVDPHVHLPRPLTACSLAPCRTASILQVRVLEGSRCVPQAHPAPWLTLVHPALCSPLVPSSPVQGQKEQSRAAYPVLEEGQRPRGDREGRGRACLDSTTGPRALPGHIMGAGRHVQQGGDWGVPSLSSSQLLLLVQGHLGKFGVSSAVNQGWEDFCLLRR